MLYQTGACALVNFNVLRDSLRHHRRMCLTTFLGVLLALTVAGCTNPLNQEAESTPTAIPTPLSTAASNGKISGLSDSVTLIREAGNPDSVLGSALILSSDGLLITSSDIAGGDVEVVLPDDSVFRPAVVSIEPSVDLALLTVPASDLRAADFSDQRLASGDETFAFGYDGTPGSLGQMSGEVTGTAEPSGSDNDFRVRGPLFIETDINLVQGFIGGALADASGSMSGIFTASADDSGERVGRAVSHWFIEAWMEKRQDHLEALYDDSADWKRMELPDEWSIPQPNGWSLNVAADDEHTYRSELTPADPDVSLQLAVSVEPNDYGTDADEFIRNVFDDRSSARIWSVGEQDGHPLVRATMSQEGALVDVAYLLDDAHLIAVSMTSDYHPEEDPEQVDEIRAIFETVVNRIDQE